MNHSHNQRKSLSRSKEAFTLIEMILVIALLMLLAGVAVVQVGGILDGGNEDVTRVKVNESFKTPLFKYKMDTGSFPTTEQGLKALLQKPAGDKGRWRGPYIEGEDDLYDAWKNPLQYRFPSSTNPGGYELFSYGQDGVQSEDDIRNTD